MPERNGEFVVPNKTLKNERQRALDLSSSEVASADEPREKDAIAEFQATLLRHQSGYVRESRKRRDRKYRRYK